MSDEIIYFKKSKQETASIPVDLFILGDYGDLPISFIRENFPEIKMEEYFGFQMPSNNKLKEMWSKYQEQLRTK